MAQTQQYPQLPARLSPTILRVLNVIELMILVEHYGHRQICARMGVSLEDAIVAAANRGQKQFQSMQ